MIKAATIVFVLVCLFAFVSCKTSPSAVTAGINVTTTEDDDKQTLQMGIVISINWPDGLKSGIPDGKVTESSAIKIARDICKTYQNNIIEYPNIYFFEFDPRVVCKETDQSGRCVGDASLVVSCTWTDKASVEGVWTTAE